MDRSRLDEFLVSEGHYATRARARDAIRRGCVFVDGKLEKKPARTVFSHSALRIDDPAQHLVSRAALKLQHALAETSYSPNGKIALDLGASTGGFCQVLLSSGATKVYAIDVGHNQMDSDLEKDERLHNLEGVNARYLTPDAIDNEHPEFITCDVSFISLKLVLPPSLEMAASGASGIFLVKPQFEAGRTALGGSGVVKDTSLALKVAEEIRDWLGTQPGWTWTHFMESPILGGDGNREFLLAGTKNE